MLLLASTAYSYPQSAQAFTLFGKCLVGQCEEQAGDDAGFIDPRRYDVTFDVALEDLAEDIKSSSQIWAGRSDAVAGTSGLITRAKGDYRRILASLYNQGYYAGSISILVNGIEASELKIGTELPQRSNIVVMVEPGPRYQFGRAEFVNRAPSTNALEDQVDDAVELGFAPGRTAKAIRIRNAARLAREEWRQQGHPFAQVSDRNAIAVHPSKQLNVTLRMEPGPRAEYGDVSVDGANRMDPDFIAYMTGIKSGQQFDPDDLKRAQKRLDRLGVFSTRKIVEAKELDANGLLPIDVLVSERKLRKIGLGATLSSVDGLGLSAYWLHRNLFGKAERLRLDAKVEGVGSGSLDVDEFDYYLGANFVQPGVFTPDTDLTTNIFGKREFNETFRETSVGGAIYLTHYYSDQLVFSGGIFANYGEFEDDFGNRTLFTTGLQGEVEYDQRDSKVDPTSGYYLSAKLRPFYEWELNNAAVRLETEGRAYFAVDEAEQSILAGRLKLGSLLGPNIRDSPPNLLFTAGGGSSVRGFAFKGIGVEDSNGDVTGGASHIEGSVEFRRKFNDSFGAVAFVDAGLVGNDPIVDFAQDAKVGVGLGLRYYTSLGPIRLDVAVPLNPGNGDPSFAVYAGIGQAF